MKNEKVARIRYIKNEEREGYLVELLDGEEWGLNSFYPLTRRENATEEEDKDFINFTILYLINQLQEFNYRIVFKF